MSNIYDNWERLVKATLDKVKLRDLAHLPSMETNSSISSDFTISPYNSQFISVLDCVPGSLMDQVIKAAENTVIFNQECLEIKSKAENLAGMLRQAARASNYLYDRPTRRIVSDTELVLEKTLELMTKCSCSSNSIPADAFQDMSSRLENSIEDVSWLISIFDPDADVELTYPPITINEPILYRVWKQITTLYIGSMDDRSAAAASLAYLARDSDQHGKLIVEEGGVGPLWNLVEEGNLEGKENAIRAIEWLAKNPENVQNMIDAGVLMSLGTTYEFQNSQEQIENEIVEATTEEFQNSPEQIVNEILGDRVVFRICGLGGVRKRSLARFIFGVKNENIFQDIFSSVKLKSFIWRISHGILSSASNLVNRHCNVPTGCFTCGENLENTLHSFFWCTKAQQTWDVSYIPLGNLAAFNEAMQRGLDVVLGGLSRVDWAQFAVTACCIWWNRNGFREEGVLWSLWTAKELSAMAA